MEARREMRRREKAAAEEPEADYVVGGQRHGSGRRKELERRRLCPENGSPFLEICQGCREGETRSGLFRDFGSNQERGDYWVLDWELNQKTLRFRRFHDSIRR